jgi:hypothetical protein
MSTSYSTHPLGYGDSDQIDPAVAEALTLYQLEWLCGQCKDLDAKNSIYSVKRSLNGSMNTRIIDFLPALLGT